MPTPPEKRQQTHNLRAFQQQHQTEAPQTLDRLKQIARDGGNLFAELMKTVRVSSLGQVTHGLYQVGGRYRRAM